LKQAQKKCTFAKYSQNQADNQGQTNDRILFPYIGHETKSKIIMSLEISGKLLQKLPEQTGEGRNGAWRKRDFIIETFDTYPKKVCISVWGDKIDMLNDMAEGTELNVAINIESREYNGRWYTDIKAWRMETLNDGGGSFDQSRPSPQSGSTPPPPPPPSGEDDLPF
jgi:hypothetical protein